MVWNFCKILELHSEAWEVQIRRTIFVNKIISDSHIIEKCAFFWLSTKLFHKLLNFNRLTLKFHYCSFVYPITHKIKIALVGICYINTIRTFLVQKKIQHQLNVVHTCVFYNCHNKWEKCNFTLFFQLERWKLGY